jgi:hypothetical protein
VLYDRVDDPYQLREISANRPDVVHRLADELKVWLERTGDPWLAL